ncbi:Uma2 family endonuclease [Crossiella cryophila]|uniref:Uma2 family endonuclease n=1 Tax=Crossiella cryophila TaxID=43355 RepID=A0A7W7CIQ8_9PSEU|nr:Uma2 family endonuclease [Crossiella cryophila]MBB4681870.1 Uma2 family endonuclease [Crossiella cryophila]
MSVAFVRHVGPWTIEDIEALPDNGNHTRYELLTPGVLTVSPAPGTRHQRASRALANLLETAAAQAGADVEILEAVNVVIPGGRLAVPDIVVVNGDYADTDPARYPATEVRAVVEIVSPSTHPQDRIIKPQLYAEAGIPVYWRLELERSPHLITSELRRGQYTHTLTAFAGSQTTISRPFPLTLDPAELVLRGR